MRWKKGSERDYVPANPAVPSTRIKASNVGNPSETVQRSIASRISIAERAKGFVSSDCLKDEQTGGGGVVDGT